MSQGSARCARLASSPLRGSQTAKLSFNKTVFAVQFMITVFFELSFIMAAAVTSQTCETKLKKSKGKQASEAGAVVLNI